VLPDEAGPDATDLLAGIGREQLLQPAIWPLELLNALTRATRRGRLPSDLAEELYRGLMTLDHRIVELTETDLLELLPRLVREHGLSSYDASYLAVAIQCDAPLLTVDGALLAAARGEGVQSWT